MNEIQPDRVVLYLWPEAGGSAFAFNFRMRYRAEAMTAASILYDYYNPEASADRYAAVLAEASPQFVRHDGREILPG